MFFATPIPRRDQPDPPASWSWQRIALVFGVAGFALGFSSVRIMMAVG